MADDTFFTLASLGVLPFWLLLIFVPRRPWAVRIIQSPLGGSFGVKTFARYVVLIALMAKKLGGRPVKPDAVDLRWVGAMLFKNGVVEETGLAAGVLNHPATGVAWLANKIAPHNEQLNAGDVVLAGSFTRPTTAVAGDNLHADYGPLGTVSFRFV